MTFRPSPRGLRRMSALWLLAAALTAPAALAQITVTRAHLDAIVSRAGTMHTYQTDASVALQTLADLSGPGQTWDATALAFNAQATTTTGPATLPAPGSDDPDLQHATHVVRIDGDGQTAYSYLRLSDEVYENLATAGQVEVEGTVVDLIFKTVPGHLVFPLPLTVGRSWTSVDTLLVLPELTDGFYAVEEISGAVEGWGTVLTPAGSFDALKLRTTVVTTSYVYDVVVEQQTERTIEFVSLSGLGFTIDLDGTMATAATYSVFAPAVAGEPTPGRDALALAVRGANPSRVGRVVSLGFAMPAAGEARLEVFDALGRRVAVPFDGPLGVGEQRASWATAGLPAGVYSLRLTAGGTTSTVRATLVP